MADYRRNITDEVMEEEAVERKPSYTSFDTKNYLNVKLAKGENEKTLRIRLLPVDKDTNSPFKEIHMHTIKVAPELAASGWKSYVCLKHTEDIDHDEFGYDCPFCEMNRIAYEKMKEAEKEGDDVERERWKKTSLDNKEKEWCVVRCIERGAEDDGPKFWKFTVRDDGKDPKSLIKALYKMRKQESIDEAKEENDGELPEDFVPENILDLETGRDLKVTITRVFDKDGKPTKKTSISIVDYGKNRPISKDEDEVNDWISDTKVWSDVFVAKPYEYLSIVLDGEVPFFDKQNKKWVSKGRVRDEDNKRQLREQQDANEKIEKAKRKALEYDEDEEEDDEEPEKLPY
jgi:hypothetical protein